MKYGLKLLDIVKSWWGVVMPVLVFFVSDMGMPDDAPWWLPWMAFFVSLGSYFLGRSNALLDAEEAKAEASSLSTALAVERERVTHLSSTLDSERSIREADRTLHDSALEAMRKSHEKEMAALRRAHAEEEDRLHAHHQAMESVLRSEIERSESLRDADRTVSQDRIEKLLRANGDLKAEVAKWKAMCVADAADPLDIEDQGA